MNKVLVACIIFWVSTICGVMCARADIIAEIHTDPFAGAVEIAEPCPVGEVTVETERVYEAISLSDDDKQLLAAILWAEANNQKAEGQKACVEVVFNRILSQDWPDDLYSVLSQKGQFATWKARNKVKPTQEQFDAIEAVLAETETVLPSTAYVYFDTRGRNGKDHVRLQDHYFGR